MGCLVWMQLITSFLPVQIYVVLAVAFFVYAARQYGGVEYLVIKWFYEHEQKSKLN